MGYLAYERQVNNPRGWAVFNEETRKRVIDNVPREEAIRAEERWNARPFLAPDRGQYHDGPDHCAGCREVGGVQSI